jgi:hypothetical protein
MDVTMGSLKQFDQRYGPYPYKILTVIDPEPGSEIGGMEYPTLITGDTGWFEPTYITELTAEHEFGHQYWYGMVATNEFEDAWLDEGINSYTEVKIMAALYGRHTSVLNFPWINFSDAELQRLQYLLAPDLDPVTRHAWQFRDANSYGGVTYGKSATLLATLEGILGSETMDDAMRTWFQHYRFTHPTTQNFLHTIEEAAIRHGKATATSYTPGAPSLAQLRVGLIPSQATTEPGAQPSRASSSQAAGGATDEQGQPQALQPFNTPPAGLPFATTTLTPFFQQAVYGTSVLDYAVDAISSDPIQWWLPEKSRLEGKSSAQYLDTVVLRRRGDFILPVTVEIIFEDGTKLREQWDGADRWHRFTCTRSTKILSAEIDPDHLILLDRNLFNNSITTKANNLPTRKLATLWITFQQLLAQLTTWLV